MDDDIPYLLLTPGPLTTSRTVRQAMLTDYCTWDDDYNQLVSGIRADLVGLAARQPSDLTAVLMQGSGTFSVESVLGTMIPRNGKVLVVNNGAYGRRIGLIAERLQIDLLELTCPETEPAPLDRIRTALSADPEITHLALVHCETTTGLLNPMREVAKLAREFGKVMILDAMSSLGGIPIDMLEDGIDVLISSANKCIQGTPGFGFVIARRDLLRGCGGQARSLSLDLHDQWWEMENKHGKWRFTSPTHVVRAFRQALDELHEEGGVEARHERYRQNQQRLVHGMMELGFRPLIASIHQSPIITAFHYPTDPSFTFDAFYRSLKESRFVIYPGKVSHADTFRIGNIGHVFPDDISQLLKAIQATLTKLKIHMPSPPHS